MFGRAACGFIRTISLQVNTYSVHQYVCKLVHSRGFSTSSGLVRRAFRRVGFLGLGGLCALPVHNVKEAGSKGLPVVNPDSLTSNTLIKNAVAMTVDSASALLTQTFVAVIDKYKDLAQDIEVLMDKVNKHSQAERLGYHSDDLWQEVIEARVNVDDRRHELQDLEAILNSALLTLEAASEAAFQAGSEELAMMGRDRCQYANTQIALTRAVIQKAENALVKVQAESIKETKTEQEDGDVERGSGKD